MFPWLNNVFIKTIRYALFFHYFTIMIWQLKCFLFIVVLCGINQIPQQRLGTQGFGRWKRWHLIAEFTHTPVRQPNTDVTNKDYYTSEILTEKNLGWLISADFNPWSLFWHYLNNSSQIKKIMNINTLIPNISDAEQNPFWLKCFQCNNINIKKTEMRQQCWFSWGSRQFY